MATDSLQSIWTETKPEQSADLDSCARRLKVLLATKNDSATCIQTIFNNTKGLPIESYRDPRTTVLKQLLKHESEAVRMAVCWALFGEGRFRPQLDDFMDGITVMSDVAMNSSARGLVSDAIWLTDRLRQSSPEAMTRIHIAHEMASIKYVERHLMLIP